MPPMLSSRPWPQTLLLTALFLLIVAATIMLACGPAAQPAPAAEPDNRMAADPESPTATPLPTAVPTVCVQWESTEERIEYCFTPEPETTPKYPNLSDHRLVDLVEEFEKAQQSAGSATGQAADGGDTLIEIWVYLSPEKVDSLAAWLESNSVSDFGKWEDAVHVWLPVSLLGPLSRQSGVRSVEMPREGVPTVIW